MGDIGVKLDQNDKAELYRLAEKHFNTQKEFLESLNISKTTYNQHVNGELETVNLEDFTRLLDVVKNSEPRFKREETETLFSEENKDSLIRKTFNYSETLAELEEGVQETVLNYFTTEELQDIFGRSKPQVKKYRCGKAKRIPLEGFKQAFTTMNSELNQEFNTKADIVDIQSYNNRNSDEENYLIAENVDCEYIQEEGHRLKKLDKLLEEDVQSTGVIKDLSIQSTELLDKNYPNSLNKKEGRLFAVLEKAGYLEKWGGKASPYQKKAPDESFKAVESVLPDRYEDWQIIKAAQNYYDRNSNVPTAEELSDSKNYLSKDDLYTRYGGYKNLLFRAGLPPKMEEYGKEELLDILRRKHYENDFEYFPLSEVEKDPYNPQAQTYKKRLEYETVEEVMAEAGIYKLENNNKWEAYSVKELEETKEVEALD